MKAIDMLTWMVNQTISTEAVSFVSICEGFDYGWRRFACRLMWQSSL